MINRRRLWTVQCGYAAYYANTVLVEAVGLEEALDRAIEQANDDPCWRALDDCGPTFVDAAALGDRDPWDDLRSAIPIPARFTERGKPPVVIVLISHGTVAGIWTKRGPVRIGVCDYDAARLRPDDPRLRTDRKGRRYRLIEWNNPIPPHDAADDPRR